MTCHDNGDDGILSWPQARLYDAGGSFQMFVANLSSTHRMVSQQDQRWIEKGGTEKRNHRTNMDEEKQLLYYTVLVTVHLATKVTTISN